MSSIAEALFNVTIGLLVDKGRDVVAERLRGGDVADETIRKLIVRDFTAVISTLNGLARKDLNASMSHLRKGLSCLFDAFKKARSDDGGSVTTSTAIETEERSYEARLTSSSETCEILRQWKAIELNDSANRMLVIAKEGFKQAEEKAIDAFSDEALETSDRIQAMRIRVAATILQNVDHPEVALAACKSCLGELHSMTAVQENFKVALDSGVRARLKNKRFKKKRIEIISKVCQVNRVIYDVMRHAHENVDLETHCVDIGSGTLVDILRDIRVTQTLPKSDVGHCCISPRLLGQDEEEPDNKLKMPQGIATDGKGHFIVGDNEDRNVKVFDRSGKFVKSLCPRPNGEDTELAIRDIATDRQDNIYVLVRLERPAGFPEYIVYVFNTNAYLYRTFSLRGSRGCKMTVNDNDKLMVLREHFRNFIVDVYNIDGQFVHSFGEGKLKDASAITAARDGRVVVAAKDGSRVRLFSETGEYILNFPVDGFYLSLNVAFYRSSSAYVVVAGKENSKKYRLYMLIYTVEGKLVRTIQLDGKGIDYLSGITVSKEGRLSKMCLAKPKPFFVICEMPCLN